MNGIGGGGLLYIDALGGGSEQLEVGEAPYAVAVGFGAVWFTDLVEALVESGMPNAGKVVRLDPATGQMRAVIPVGQRPSGIATGGGSIWVANGGRTISEIDPETNQVVGTIRTRYYPHHVTYGHGFLWVSLHRDPFDI